METNEYFCTRYSVPYVVDLTSFSWFPYVNVNSKSYQSFDMNPFKPKDVKNVLKRKKARSSPGDDGLMYGMLKHL